jgi:hypothetical protein
MPDNGRVTRRADLFSVRETCYVALGAVMLSIMSSCYNPFLLALLRLRRISFTISTHNMSANTGQKVRCHARFAAFTLSKKK